MGPPGSGPKARSLSAHLVNGRSGTAHCTVDSGRANAYPADFEREAQEGGVGELSFPGGGASISLFPGEPFFGEVIYERRNPSVCESG